MLDHDLHQQQKTEKDGLLSGSDLVRIIIRSVDRSAAILVHSMNSIQA